MEFTFGQHARAHLPLTDKVIQTSQTLRMLVHRKESSIKMNELEHTAFVSFVHAVNMGRTINLTGAPEIIAICSFLLVDEEVVEQIVPEIWPGAHAKCYLPTIHKLLVNGFPRIAQNLCIKGRLPPHLCQNPEIGYHAFKTKYRNASRFKEWYTKCRIPRCKCEKCQDFRHQRFLQQSDFDETPYPSPYFGIFTKPWPGPPDWPELKQ
jgi:hypothetical protein